MILPNNIRAGVQITKKMTSDYARATSKRINDLTKQIKIKNESIILEKSTLAEREYGPVWVRFPIIQKIWRAGSRKVWNRDLGTLELGLGNKVKELRYLKNVLGIEKRKQERINSTAEHLQKLYLDPVSTRTLSGEDQRKLNAITDELKSYPIMSEQALMEAAASLQALLDEIKKSPAARMPPVVKKETAAPQLLPYRTSFHEPIYLPIPKTLGYLVKNLGASYDHNVQKAGRYFVPANTDLKPFDRYLPLAFRERPPEIQFYPAEPDTAKRVNLRTIFDSETWDYIRSTNYAKTDNRCAVCGKRSGDLLDRMAPENVHNRAEKVECHEVWEFYRPKKEFSIGVQKLKALYIVCFKCHMTFHDRIARGMLASDQDPLQFARDLHSHRSHITRLDEAVIYNQMVDLNKRAKTMNKIDYWIVDLSHLTNQDYMRHISPVFLEHNRAGVGVEQIAGFEFTTDTGERLPAREVQEVFYQIAPRYPAISVESLMANRKM